MINEISTAAMDHVAFSNATNTLRKKIVNEIGTIDERTAEIVSFVNRYKDRFGIKQDVLSADITPAKRSLHIIDAEDRILLKVAYNRHSYNGVLANHAALKELFNQSNNSLWQSLTAVRCLDTPDFIIKRKLMNMSVAQALGAPKEATINSSGISCNDVGKYSLLHFYTGERFIPKDLEFKFRDDQTMLITCDNGQNSVAESKQGFKRFNKYFTERVENSFSKGEEIPERVDRALHELKDKYFLVLDAFNGATNVPKTFIHGDASAGNTLISYKHKYGFEVSEYAIDMPGAFFGPHELQLGLLSQSLDTEKKDGETPATDYLKNIKFVRQSLDEFNVSDITVANAARAYGKKAYLTIGARNKELPGDGNIK
jgi:hypothetical protein